MDPEVAARASQPLSSDFCLRKLPSGETLALPRLPGGVMVAQQTLTLLVMVRVHAGQPILEI
jgi:hypothetical protein